MKRKLSEKKPVDRGEIILRMTQQRRIEEAMQLMLPHHRRHREKVVQAPQFETASKGPGNYSKIEAYYEARRQKPRNWCKGRSRAAARRRARRK